MIAQPDDRILNKIKKCLALSQSPEPAEAAAALRQAQKLMAMHNIDQAAIGRAEIGEAEIKSKVSVSRVKDWELRLLNVVTKAFGCKLIWIRSNSHNQDVFGRYVIVGLKQQVQLAHYTADVMQRKLVKARGQYVAGLDDYLSRADKSKQANGFCHGWVEMVGKTVHAFANSTETDLLIEETIQTKTGGATAKLTQSRIGSHGLAAGREAGAGEFIRRPMGANGPVLQLAA